MFPMVLFGVILDYFVCITKILLKLEIVEIKKVSNSPEKYGKHM